MMMGRLKAVLLLGLAFGATGCFRHTYRVQQNKTLGNVKSASLDDLVKQTQDRFDAIKTMNASVDIVASMGGAKQGKVTEYTPFSGYILLRKPEDLRVLMLLPVVHTRALDMVTDGKSFKMLIPPRNQAITGTNNAPSEPNKNALYNLRPADFYNSMLIRGIAKDELVAITSGDRLYQPDPRKKEMISEPDYDLSIYIQKPGTSELATHRVIHIGRATLLPYQQDIYDANGRIITRSTYDDYRKEGDIELPHRIVMERPLDELKIEMTLTKLIPNQEMENDQFELTIPPSAQVQALP